MADTRSNEEFHADLFQEVAISADSDGRFLEDSFFEVACQAIVESGDLESADRSYFEGTRMRVDGYSYDPSSESETMTLIVLAFHQDSKPATIDQKGLLATFARLDRFLKSALDSTFRRTLEESSSAFGLSEMIADRWDDVRRVRLMLVTNRVLSTRIDGLKAGELAGRTLTYSVWDLDRLRRLAEAGGGREEVEVNFERDFGQPLPALRAHLEGATYEAYLAVVPGSQLAEIYGRWGSRLLEQNVRAFLQARGAVNRGLRTTLENEPEMFLAYNNGITATAEQVETAPTSDGMVITRIRNLQIVNGGQTTASVHAASLRPGADLSRVFVQLKLSVIDSERAQEVVPKISEFANTQNRVNAADFFSNHPFHVRIEDFSRRISAPSREGTFAETKWFYERARGQYQDARLKQTAAGRARFDREFPKAQMFVKTDLAKFHNSWYGLPHIVSAGAQKNFVAFAQAIGDAWVKGDTQFSQQFFRDTIARAILFRRTEQLVSKQPWYTGGYRANIVTYTIAKVVHDSTAMGRVIDLTRIWRNQALWDDLERILIATAEVVNEVLLRHSGNVSEYAKQQACWKRVQEARVVWPEALREDLPTVEEWREIQSDGQQDQEMLNGIEAQVRVVELGGDFWSRVNEWASSNGEITPTEHGILKVAARIPERLPTEAQSERLLEALKRYRAAGCPLDA